MVSFVVLISLCTNLCVIGQQFLSGCLLLVFVFFVSSCSFVFPNGFAKRFTWGVWIRAGTKRTDKGGMWWVLNFCFKCVLFLIHPPSDFSPIDFEPVGYRLHLSGRCFHGSMQSTHRTIYNHPRFISEFHQSVLCSGYSCRTIVPLALPLRL